VINNGTGDSPLSHYFKRENYVLSDGRKSCISASFSERSDAYLRKDYSDERQYAVTHPSMMGLFINTFPP
jgi:hypothetical protein